ncbi:MAG: purine-nucleoside phosphorylase [Thermoanaerobaculia bacterium]|nr:purine-nucleoside phosphorylase [Thermoanaerobaculia bacterium]
MDHLAHQLDAAASAWRERGWPIPQIFVVSGSGLAADLGEPIVPATPWLDLLPFEVEGIEGHPLTLELIEAAPGRVVASSRGRLHAYQGYTPAQVVFPLRLMRLLGAEVLLMTNSSGGLHSDHRPGDMVLLNDHINMMGLNPLYGRFPESWGPQFPDMAQAYDPELRGLLRNCAEELGFELEEGVYVGMAGPSYETPAEVRTLQTLGADAVGMSTVVEVIAAHHMGMRCGCVSVVSNPAAGVTDEVLDHADVLSRAKSAALRIGQLFQKVLSHPDLL